VRILFQGTWNIKKVRLLFSAANLLTENRWRKPRITQLGAGFKLKAKVKAIFLFLNKDKTKT